MAKKKPRSKKSKPQLSLKVSMNDERVPKIFGLFCLLIALYLLVAFSSFLFTWEADMDKVNHFSWGILFESGLEIQNWLGRLGAVVSHQFIMWWFGLSSFVFVFLFFITGISLIKRTPVSKLSSVYRYSTFGLIWGSVFFAFIFYKLFQSGFPWGGAFGNAIVDWLSSFVGIIGVIAFLAFTMGGLIVWWINPNFNELSMAKVKEGVKSKLPVKESSQQSNHKEDEDKQNTQEDEEFDIVDPTEKRQTLRPKSKGNEVELELSEEEKTAAEEKRKKEEEAKAKRLEFEKVSSDKDEDALMFELEKQPVKKVDSLKVGEQGLEIEEASGEDKNENPVQQLSVTEGNTNHLEPYDSTLELASYENPTLSLLEDYGTDNVVIDRTELENNKDQIISTLLNYKIEIIKIKATIGPTVTLYEIVPAPGVRISKIKNLEDDIALSLAALGIRIIAPIPGRGTIGIEVPNRKPQIVSLKETLASEKFKRAKMDLPIALGKTISNEVMVVDLAKMPHLLIAGATGQGKSVGINTILMSLLYKKHPSQVKLILIDPKKVELSPYNKIANHYLGYLPGEDEAIVTDTSKVVQTLHSLTIEMDERYNLLKKAHVRNIREYNGKFVQRKLNPEKGHRFLPYIVLVIDEFADLIMTAGKEVELPIGRLAQLARAVGIHLIIATQRPSVNIITGVIKANFPARIAFKVTSRIDSRTILDSGGADQLIGRGDMLLSVDGNIVRIQCAFVDTPEVERVIDYISDQRGYPEPFLLPAYGAEEEAESEMKKVIEELDENFDDAARLVVMNQMGSTSMIQRRLKLGYNRAGRIMDQLEHTGIVGPARGSKPREVYLHDELELEKFLEALKAKRNKTV